MTPGVCVYCECTRENGCEGGCAWSNEEETLCTRCELALQFATATLPVMTALAAKAPAGATTWEELGPEHQKALVMATRLLSDGVRNSFFEAVGDDVTNAVVDLATFASEMYRKFPAEMQQADAVGDSPLIVALELLDKHASARVVLAP